MRLFLASVLALHAGAAFASGGVHCSADADEVAFEVNGGVTHGMGGGLFSFAGEITIAVDGMAAELANTKFAREHVAQYWLDGEDLRLLLYREREGDKPHGYVELTIRTKARGGDDGEGTYEGRYELTVYDMTNETDGEGVTVAREGEVVCSAE